MKNIITLIALSLGISVSAQNADSLALAEIREQIINLESAIKIHIGELETVNADLKSKIVTLNVDNAELKSQVADLECTIKIMTSDMSDLKAAQLESSARDLELQSDIEKNAGTIKEAKDSLVYRINTNAKALLKQGTTLKSSVIWGSVVAVIIFIISILLSLILHKKGDSKIAQMKAESIRLNEEIVNKLSTEASDLQKIATSIAAVPNRQGDTSAHTLIKTLADRITFMEMTLYRMDKSVRGYKQLTKSIVQMKENLLANGYEIVDMLGKPYHEGMKVNSTFIENDELESGQQIITGVVKPQINYNGVMIQSAQITVSQNI